MDLEAVKSFVKPFYHNRKGRGWAYVEKLLDRLEKKKGLTQEQSEILSVVILFYHIVFDPQSSKNQEKSAAVLKESFSRLSLWKDAPEKQAEAMRLTLGRSLVFGDDPLSNALFEVTHDIFQQPINAILSDEQDVFLAYQKLSLEQYMIKRITMLQETQKLVQEHPGFGSLASQKIGELIDFIKNRVYKIGLYPGSFNPFHIGHDNILQKAEMLFDKVIIARGINPEKQGDRYPMPTSLPNEIIVYSSFVFELFQQKPDDCRLELFLIRGLRNEFDLDSEENLRSWVHDFSPHVRFVYFFCDKEFEHINSSQIKSLASFDPTLINRYLVP